MASNLKISDVIPEVSKSKDDSAFLSKIYEKINFIDEDSIVNEYVNGLNSILLFKVIMKYIPLVLI